jgi:transposase
VSITTMEAPVETAYAGRQIVGMDLHRRRSVLVQTSESGECLGTTRIDNDPFVLAEQVTSWGEAPQVVLEATYGWYWAADVLAEAGAEVHLAHPLGVKGFAYRRVKNDERDAADLADLLRMGRLPETHIASAPVRELRELVRHRAKLARWRASLKSSVHAVLAKRGVVVPMSDLFGVEGTRLLDGLRLEPGYTTRVSSLRELLAVLDTEIARFDWLIAALLAGHPGYRAIQQLSGIGPVFAAVFVAEIGDVGRFSTAAKLCCWAGFDPAAPRVRHQGAPGTDHQAGLHAGALGGGGGRAAQPRTPGDRAPDPHRRPAWPPRPAARPQYREGGRRPGAAAAGLLRAARWHIRALERGPRREEAA